MTPRAVLPKCGSPDFPSARIRYRLSDTQSRCVGWRLDPVDEVDTRPRIVGDQDVAVEVERVRRVRHADRLADAAGLRELDVDPVRALRTRRDVGQRVAVLVDVD